MTTPRRHRTGSTANYFHLIAGGNLKSPQAITKTLTDVLAARDYSDCVKDLAGIGVNPQSYIDGLDKVCPCFVFPLAILRS